MSKLKNLLRSKFIAALIVLIVGIIKKYVPDLPTEAIYGLLAYIGFEGITDALGAVRGSRNGKAETKPTEEKDEE